MKISVFENSLEFKNPDEIHFPKNCVVCGAETNLTTKEKLYSSSVPEQRYKNNYSFAIPICLKCYKLKNIKKGVFSSEGLKVLVLSALGLMLSILLGLVTYSIFISIAIFSIFFIFSYINYRKKVKDKIDLIAYINIELKREDEEDVIKMTFYNENYVKFLGILNSKKNKERIAIKRESYAEDAIPTGEKVEDLNDNLRKAK